MPAIADMKNEHLSTLGRALDQHAWHAREQARGALALIVGVDFAATIEGFLDWIRKATYRIGATKPAFGNAPSSPAPARLLHARRLQFLHGGFDLDSFTNCWQRSGQCFGSATWIATSCRK